jgi:hypothetical protein
VLLSTCVTTAFKDKFLFVRKVVRWGVLVAVCVECKRTLEMDGVRV